MWAKGNHHALSVDCNLVQPVWKAAWRVLKKLRIELQCNPASPLLGVHLKNRKTPIQKDACGRTVTAAYLQWPSHGNKVTAWGWLNAERRCGTRAHGVLLAIDKMKDCHL